MKKQILFSLITSIITINAFSQQFSSPDCGIANLYDANGNRRTRWFVCNNGTNYPQRTNIGSGNASSTEIKTPDIQQESSLNKNVLYPNPTSGPFYIIFEVPLKNAQVSLIDMNGKTIQQQKVSGTKLSFDLSGKASGVYMVRIEEEGKRIIKKIVKQ